MEKIIDIIDSIAYEKGLNPTDIKEEVKAALIATVKYSISEDVEFVADIDEDNKKLLLFQKIVIVENNDERLKDSNHFISFDEAKKIDPNLKIGDYVEYQLDIENLGRTAANFLFKEIEHRVQILIEKQLFDKLKAKEGKIITGSVERIDTNSNTIIEINEVRGVLSLKNRIKGEKFKHGDVVKSILKYVNISSNGIKIELSRTTPKFIEELLIMEVPEIKDGVVKIESAARIPGVRAKISVTSYDPKVDPIGSVVGVKGTRVNAVSNELNGESIDVIEYSNIPEVFISRALSPATINSVKIINSTGENAKKTAVVTLYSDQKSKAIGKAGINIRLAMMLTGYHIEIEEIEDKMSSSSTTSSVQLDEPKKDIGDLASLFK